MSSLQFSTEVQVQDSGLIYHTVNIEIDNKYKYEIHITNKCESINVWRTKNGQANHLQRISKTFWSWEEVAKNYKVLAPHIEFLKKTFNELMKPSEQTEEKTENSSEQVEETVNENPEFNGLYGQETKTEKNPMVSFQLMGDAMTAFAIAEEEVKYFSEVFCIKLEFVKLGIYNNEIYFRVAARKTIESLPQGLIEDLEEKTRFRKVANKHDKILCIEYSMKIYSGDYRKFEKCFDVEKVVTL